MYETIVGHFDKKRYYVYDIFGNRESVIGVNQETQCNAYSDWNDLLVDLCILKAVFHTNPLQHLWQEAGRFLNLEKISPRWLLHKYILEEGEGRAKLVFIY